MNEENPLLSSLEKEKSQSTYEKSRFIQNLCLLDVVVVVVVLFVTKKKKKTMYMS